VITYKRYFNKEFIKSNHYSDVIFPGLELINHFWANSARTGLLLVFDKLGITSEDTILIPAFAPHGIVLPAKKKKINISFYKLDKDLSPDIDFLNQQLVQSKNIKAIVLIHYFGFPKDFSSIIEIAHKQNIFVIEDCAHLIVYDFNNKKDKLGRMGDISLFSLTKFLPVPDGSLFIINNDSIDFSNIRYEKSLINHISSLSNYLQLLCRTEVNRIKSPVIRKIFSIFSIIFNSIYYWALCQLNYPSNISATSNKILHSLELGKLVDTRKKNMRYLFEMLDFKSLPAIFSEPVESNIIGIPILYNNKPELKNRINRAGISLLSFNKYWWFVPKTEEYLFEDEKKIHDFHFLIPISENMTKDELNYLIEKINKISTDANID
jgi:dTDP-4-amino-4,6-dideoxygalactose transaminase